ncbi:MAG: FAD:protein FMN transferase [Sedimentisphaerales bacterium]|jgi:thiamine biosynthesis lipoprotein
MSEPQPQTSQLDKDLCGIANLHRFWHAAMAATFEVFVIHQDAVYAEQAAWAAFEELDRLEANLSRFIENSDVSRINSLGPGRPLQIGLDTFECLRISIEMCKQTKGAFDITFGSLHPGSKLMKLNEADHTIELLDDGIQIDLGAIGKGYAADKMGQLLGDWGINTVLISAGQSTIMPIGTPPGLTGWPVTLSDPADCRQLLAKCNLAGRAISASGLQKGPHIIDPRSGMPATGKRLAAWATAQTGAVADALSTAFMVMTAERVRAFCSAHADTSALLVNKKVGGRLLRFGQWDKADFCG